LEPAAKRARINRWLNPPSSAQSVAFITCSEILQNFAVNRNAVEALLQAIRKALEAGANFIHIAFDRTFQTVRADMIELATILPELQSVFNAAWTSSVGQPAYDVKLIGSVMSFFAASCGTLFMCKLSGLRKPVVIMGSFSSVAMHVLDQASMHVLDQASLLPAVASARYVWAIFVLVEDGAWVGWGLSDPAHFKTREAGRAYAMALGPAIFAKYYGIDVRRTIAFRRQPLLEAMAPAEAGREDGGELMASSEESQRQMAAADRVAAAGAEAVGFGTKTDDDTDMEMEETIDTKE
jgi:hypothetical protein